MRRPSAFQVFVSTIRPLEWAYCGAVALAVIPFGSVYPTLVGVSCFTFGTLAIVSCFLPVPERRLERLAAGLTVLVALLLGWALAQTIQLPANSFAHPIWAEVSSLVGPVGGPGGGQVGGPGGGTISVNPGATIEGLLALVAPALAGLAALRLFASDAAALRLWRFLGSFGAGLILVTLAQYILLPGTLLIYEKWAYQADFTVTFVNRNTAATFVGVVLLLNVGWAMLLAEDLRLARWVKRMLALDFKIGDANGRFALQLIITFFVFASLFLTRSRAGAACTFLGVLVFGLLIVRSRWAAAPVTGTGTVTRTALVPRMGWRRRGLILAGAGLLVGLIGLFWLLGGATTDRVAEEGFEDTARLCTYLSVIGAIGDHWLVGTGFGTFIDTFPAYRDPACTGIIGIWDRAHDSYLELVLGVGVMGVGIILGVFWLIGSTLRTGFRSRQRLRFAPMASIGILVLIASHALVDFSLQIPGFAIFAAAALAAGSVLSLGRGRRPT